MSCSAEEVSFVEILDFVRSLEAVPECNCGEVMVFLTVFLLNHSLLKSG